MQITDEAVGAAAREFYGGAYLVPDSEMNNLLRLGARKALEAAAPLLAPQPVVDREALVKALRAELVEHGVDEFHDPAPLSRQIADAVLALINGGAK